MTSVSTSYVRSNVGSNWPLYLLLHLTMMSLYFYDLPQLSVWAGVSI